MIKNNKSYLLQTVAVIAVIIVILTIMIINIFGSSYTEYTVAAGDSLYKIASKFKVTVDDIIKLNNIENPDRINIGMVLKIPASSEQTTSAESSSNTESETTPETKPETSSPVNIENDVLCNLIKDSCLSLIPDKDLYISFNFVNTDIREILNAIASYTGYTVICRASDKKIDFSIENVTINEAIEDFMQKAELTYNIVDNVLYSAPKGKLDSLYDDEKSLTEITLKNITADYIINQIKALDISVTATESEKDKSKLQLQGIAFDLACVYNIVSMTDISGAAEQLPDINIKNLNYSSVHDLYKIFSSINIYENDGQSSAKFPSGMVLKDKSSTIYLYANKQQTDIASAVISYIDTAPSVSAELTKTGIMRFNLSNISVDTLLQAKFENPNSEDGQKDNLIQHLNRIDTEGEYTTASVLKISTDKKSFWIYCSIKQFNSLLSIIESHDLGI